MRRRQNKCLEEGREGEEEDLIKCLEERGRGGGFIKSSSSPSLPLSSETGGPPCHAFYMYTHTHTHTHASKHMCVSAEAGGGVRVRKADDLGKILKSQNPSIFFYTRSLKSGLFRMCAIDIGSPVAGSRYFSSIYSFLLFFLSYFCFSHHRYR
jgi:hypothetical protein